MKSTEKIPENDGKEVSKDRLKSILILVVLLLVILTGIFFIFHLKSDKSGQNLSSNYEILMKDITRNELTMQIFCKDTAESELIGINDDILKQFPDTTMTKYIFYFDDKAHTGKFFELFMKPRLTPEEQNEMAHNFAMYYFDKSMTKSNPPCLTKRLTQGWKTIKCY